MNWQDEQFVKVYTRDTGEWTLLSWDAQALLLQLFRKVDRAGVLQLGKHGTRVLPAVLGHREQSERILSALTELLEDGCVVMREGCLVVPNFMVAQTTRQSDKARQQSARDRRRLETLLSGLQDREKTSRPVTNSHLASPKVTTHHPESPGVTLEEIRLDKKRLSTVALGEIEPSQPDLPLQPQQAAVGVDDGQANKSQPEAIGQAKAPTAIPKPQVAKQIALTLFGELQAARKRCNPAVKLDPLKASGTHTAEIERCLRSGVTPDQIRHVIACWEALVKSGKREREHFNSVTPFRASNVAQYIEMTLEDAAKPRPGYGKQPSTPEKPKPQPKEPSEWEKRRDAFLREQAEKSKETKNNS